MADLSSRVRHLVLGQESTYGTDVIDLTSGTVDPGFSAFDPTFNNPLVERDIMRPSFGRVPHLNIRRNVSVSVSGEVNAAENPGASGTEAPLGLQDILVANGFTETVVDSTSATYAPSTKATASLSAYYYLRELADTDAGGSDLWRMTYLTGLRGSGMTLSGEAGGILGWESTLESNNYPYDTAQTTPIYGWSEAAEFIDSTDGSYKLDKNGDAIVGASPSIHTPTPMYLESATVELGSGDTSFCVSSFTVTVTNTLKLKECTGADPTVDRVIITGREVSFELTLEESGTAYNQFLADLHANGTFDVVIVCTDGLGSGESTLTITMNDCQFDQATFNDSDGLAAWTIPGFAQCDFGADIQGDNDISLAWTVTA